MGGRDRKVPLFSVLVTLVRYTAAMTAPDIKRLDNAGLNALHDTYRKQVDAWIRPVDGRWRFVDNAGCGYWMDQEDGAALHEAAHQRVDEMFSSLDGSSWLKVFVMFVLTDVGIFGLAQFGLLGTMSGFIYLLPAILFFFKDVITEVEYAFAMHRLRAEIARALGGGSRTDASSQFLFELTAPNLLLASGGALCVTAGIASLVVTDQTMLLKVGVLAGLALIAGIALKVWRG